MLAKRLHTWLIPAHPSVSQTRFWLSLSLTFAALFGILGLQKAFANFYIVQDDARQHIFWMQRFLDPQLFPNDWIADYFQSVAPWGYSGFYRVFAAIGIDPLLLSKLLPPLLGLIATYYGFRLALQLLPVPLTGFLACLLLNYLFWSQDDLASATPRAFMLPIFLAFLHFLLKRSLLACLILIALEGLFYPQFVFVFAGLLLWLPLRWQSGRLRLSENRWDYWFCGAGLLVAFLVLLPYALVTTQFDPVVSVAEAKQLPDFYVGGRNPFFYPDPLYFWLVSFRGGLFPTFKPFLLAIGFLLPLLYLKPLRNRLPLLRQTKPLMLLQITIVALGLFMMAHLLLFRLHLPSRYSAYTLRIVLVYAAAIVLTVAFDGLLHGLQRSRQIGIKAIAWALIGVTTVTLLLYPSYAYPFMKVNYKTGPNPQLYQFFAQQPKDTIIASLVQDIDFVPTFAKRPILVGREYAIPYHDGYITPFRQRANDLIRAQYSLDRAALTDVIRTYGIDFWVVSRDSFRPEFLKNTWIRQYPEAIEQAVANLQQGTPALARQRQRCTVQRDGNLIVLDATCLLRDSR
ncbi:hypothetical protein [Leptolyngbya sp. FACHB-711]|uniref:hypothetical protein n=1 Tax=Leptolyngbya sp. FACHB-711 TaxID=2692813 RepID=UPI0016841DFD|nr:hypothetical protein [Leptolyngbya sp. FACHB-711]MBD2023377.1 hypothetical protein [Leptolyngbya sp. FACHB-711]